MEPGKRLFWKGRPLSELSREELIDVVEVLQQQFEESADNFNKLAKLNARIMASRIQS